MFRILITGSRDWEDHIPVGKAILGLKENYPFNWDDVVIVHGGCPTGADAIAESFARATNLKTEVHPADWDQFGKFAGPKRNQEMIDAGADVVLAFPKGLSKGTRGTIKKAQEAGLDILIYEGDSYDLP